jgi:hypothetical protein
MNDWKMVFHHYFESMFSTEPSPKNAFVFVTCEPFLKVFPNGIAYVRILASATRRRLGKHKTTIEEIKRTMKSP